MAMQCAEHPDVETGLACGKCEKPICPRCLHHTPVGARCRECANIRRLPTYQISVVYLLRAAGAGLVVALALGAVWGLLLPFNTVFFLGLIAGLGLGYAVGEAVSVAANRKTAPPLQAIAAGGVVVAYLVRSVILVSPFENIGVIDLVRNDLLGYIAVAIGVAVAMSRVR